MIDYQPIVLAIIDGWGISSSWGGNAILMGNPSNYNYLIKNYPFFPLKTYNETSKEASIACDSANSYLSIGAGKILADEITRINSEIKDGTFSSNESLKKVMNYARDYNHTLHIIGIVSDGGIHGHIDHIKALVKMAKKMEIAKVSIHAILDGIDTKPFTGLKYLNDLQTYIDKIKLGQISTLCGRNYILDKSENWDNIGLSLSAIIHSKGKFSKSISNAMKKYYYMNISDQYIPPTIINNTEFQGNIQDGDSVIFTSYRSDLAKEVTIGILGYHRFKKIKIPERINFCSFTSYFLPDAIEKKALIAFPPKKIDCTLGRIISSSNLRQLRITESERKSHITTFFNGGYNEVLPGEEHIIINSNNRSSYDKNSKIIAEEITNNASQAINQKEFNFILINYSNIDIIARTGNIPKTATTVKIIDNEIGKLLKSTMDVNGTLIITSNHGNAEKMIRPEVQIYPEFSCNTNPVPFIFVRSDAKSSTRKTSGEDILSKLAFQKNSIADIAPTILELLDIDIPASMNGKSLLKYILGVSNVKNKS